MGRVADAWKAYTEALKKMAQASSELDQVLSTSPDKEVAESLLEIGSITLQQNQGRLFNSRGGLLEPLADFVDHLVEPIRPNFRKEITQSRVYQILSILTKKYPGDTSRLIADAVSQYTAKVLR